MRCLLFESIIAVCLIGCASEYAHLQKTQNDGDCPNRILPLVIQTSWYDASVDVSGRHISGLLLFKNMPDSSKRIVFTNEAGLTFFDFSFSKAGRFSVVSVIKQFNRKAVIQTLEKDFALVLGIPFLDGVRERYTTVDDVYFGFKQKNGTAYFITNKDCASLLRLEWGDKGKRLVTVRTPGSGFPTPATIEVDHHTFRMNIKLTRIQKE
ncbi:MAG TPA: hypothetical protein VK589_16815 [Chryseolinea sp.]|nr:hypothetical protein [Chryseolinea sp.]